ARGAAPGTGCREPASAPMPAATTSSSSCRRCRAYSSQGHGLPGIHDVERIERPLDSAHEVDSLAVLVCQHVELMPADAVLSGAGAAHGDRPQAHPARERLGPPSLRLVVGIEEHDQMKVAVADVADDRCDQA